MKLQTSLKIAAAMAGLVLAGSRPALAQTMPGFTNDYAPGLIGETYTGAEFGYLNRSDRTPEVMHRYGFIVSQPIDHELTRTDAAFRYSYLRGSANGIVGQTHELAASLLHYVPAGEVKPFLQGELGYAWARGLSHQNSAVFAGRVGVEILLAPRLAFTPFAQYRSTPAFHDDGWTWGGKLTRRFERAWSGSFGVQFDDSDGVEFTLGVQRRY
jgi:hypothetical protein